MTTVNKYYTNRNCQFIVNDDNLCAILFTTIRFRGEAQRFYINSSGTFGFLCDLCVSDIIPFNIDIIFLRCWKMNSPTSSPQKASHDNPSHPPRTFAALRHRNFQLYLGGQLVSVAGTWVQVVAQGWLVYQISHSELLLGVTSFASAIPAMLISPWGGALVDRVPKRNLLVATQSFSMLLAFILAWLALSGQVREWHIILLAAGLGLINAFDAPGRQSFVVEMVGRADLTNAIALNSLMFNSGRVVGPAIGGILLATVGAGWCFLINGFSFLAVIAGLLLMRLPHFESKATSPSLFRDLQGGIGYVLTHSNQRGLILLALVLNFFGMSYAAVLPAFVDQVLQVSAAGYGWINTAIGLGAIISALFLASHSAPSRRGRWLVTANLVFPLILIAFALNSYLPLALLLAFGLGIGFMLQFTLLNTLLQTRVSDEMRGRVMGLYSVTIFGIGPFGNLVIGWLSGAWGLSLTIALSAVLALALSAVIFWKISTIARLP